MDGGGRLYRKVIPVLQTASTGRGEGVSNEDRLKEHEKWQKEWFAKWCKLIEDHMLQEIFMPIPEHFGFEYLVDDYYEGIECKFIPERGAPICVKMLFFYANMAHER
ncbi:MAG: hypothetical protein ACHQF2_07325, partial [Flavobacteriales bacterium]